MFNALDEKEFEIILDAMSEMKVKKGEQIIKEGDVGDQLYVVESGTLECTKLIDNQQKFLKNYEAGEVFGELALLYNVPRAANINAKEDAHLWILDRNTFNHIVKFAAQ